MDRDMIGKKNLVRFLLCAAIAAAVCGCGGSKNFRNPKRGDTLVMAANTYAEPYVYFKDGEVTGIDVEIARAIADVLGMELQIRDVEYDAILETVNSQKAHIGMSGMIVTAENREQADFSDPYMKITQSVLVQEDSGITTAGELEDRVVGVLSGASADIISSSLSDAIIREYDYPADAVQALANGVIDAVIIGRKPAEELASGAEGIRLLEEDFTAEGYGIAVAKDNEELLDDIDKALDVVIADGTVRRIVNQYMGDE